MDHMKDEVNIYAWFLPVFTLVVMLLCAVQIAVFGDQEESFAVLLEEQQTHYSEMERQLDSIKEKMLLSKESFDTTVCKVC